MEHREIHYSGRVQGVGFRYTTHRVAQGFRVVGFVKNLPDGRVQLVVEGESAELDAFLGKLSDAVGGMVQSAEAHSGPAQNLWIDFSIQH